nr:NAC domain-containing protein 40-like [Ipomoea batatas]
MGDGHASSSRNSNNNNSTEIPLATASAMFPGFRFSPTDEELISYYLKKKLEGSDRCVEVISEVEIWKHEPWDLPVKSVIQSDNEWFFFSPRGRKYPNGSQSRRATESGYWKATGKERNVKSGSNVIGTKRTLVFHTGRAPKGQRTQWIMHEYCMNGRSQPQDSMVVCRLRKNNEFHLNEAPRNQMNNSNANNSMTALSGADPAGSSGGVNAGESCSKECSSSFNSHSVEQIDSDSDSDSDEKLVNEISLHHPPGHQKDFFDAEDWFADIMKDDIVKLDDSSLNPHLDTLPATTTKPEPEPQQNQATAAQGFTPDLFPFQGTANRRLRLRKEAVGFSEAAQGEPFQLDKQQLLISRGRMKRCSIYVCFLSLIILLFCCSGLLLHLENMMNKG